MSDEKIISGCLLRFYFDLQKTYTGLLLPFSFDIQKKTSGKLSDFSVEINKKASVKSLSLPRQILRSASNSGEWQFQKNGVNKRNFNLSVLINNIEIDYCKLLDNITIKKVENCASIAELTLKSNCGEFDFYEYAGKTIEIFCIFENESKKIYSGFINTPEYDFFTKRIKMQCTDEKTNRINNLDWNVIHSIGFYSKKMFENIDNKQDEFNKRIETVTKSYFFDFDNNFVLFDWQTKTPKFTFDTCDFWENTIKATPLKTGSVVNKINLLFQFQYPRKLQRDLTMNYTGQGVGFMDFVQTYNFIPAPPVNSVVQAIQGAGWVVGNFNYTGLPNEGDYNGVHWSPAGYKWYYAAAAQWTASKRWVQNTQEDYKITIKNQLSIDTLNEKIEDLTLNLVLKDENSDWTNYNCYLAPPSGNVGNGDKCETLTADDLQEYTQAFNYALNLAKTKIIRSHRENTVQGEVKFEAGLDLGDTISINHKNFIGNAVIAELTQSFDLTKRIAKNAFLAKWIKNFSGDVIELNLPERVVLPIPQRIAAMQNFGNVINKIYSSENNTSDIESVDFDFCPNEIQTDQVGFVMNEFIADIANPNATTGKISAVKFAVKTPEIEQESTDANQAEKNVYYDLSITNTDADQIVKIYC